MVRPAQAVGHQMGSTVRAVPRLMGALRKIQLGNCRPALEKAFMSLMWRAVEGRFVSFLTCNCVINSHVLPVQVCIPVPNRRPNTSNEKFTTTSARSKHLHDNVFECSSSRFEIISQVLSTLLRRRLAIFCVIVLVIACCSFAKKAKAQAATNVYK